MHLSSIVTACALALSLPLVAAAAAGSNEGAVAVAKRGGHKQHIKRSDRLVKRDYTGIATFYNGETGQQGACGVWVKNDGWTVAIAGHLYGDYGQKSYWCGKQLVITGNGKTTTATVVDACPGCQGAAGLDMTPGLFAYFISPDAGVMDITWHLAGEDAPAPAPEKPKPQPEPEYTPPTTHWTPPAPAWTPPSSTWTSPSSTWTPEWTPSSSSWTPEWTPSSSSSVWKPSPSSSSSKPSSSSSSRSSSSSKSSSSSSAAASSTALFNGTNTNSTLRSAANGNSTGLTNSTLLPNSTEVAVGRNGSSSAGGATTNITDGTIASGKDNKNADGTTGNLGRTAQIVLDLAGLAYAAAEQN